VSVRYIVDEVDAAIAFYRDRLGFDVVMHPAPPFAMLARDTVTPVTLGAHADERSVGLVALHDRQDVRAAAVERSPNAISPTSRRTRPRRHPCAPRPPTDTPPRSETLLTDSGEPWRTATAALAAERAERRDLAGIGAVPHTDGPSRIRTCARRIMSPLL
jgi:catechol 2,3-dioxygenase-like lactoylglutathione lyase family enzyme